MVQTIILEEVLEEITFEEGLTRKIDSLGRIVIPSEFRKAMGLDEQSSVLVSMVQDVLIIKPFLEGDFVDGVRRPVDGFGRICIPSEFKKKLGLQTREDVSMAIRDEYVFIKKDASKCLFCGKKTPLRALSKPVCGCCHLKLRHEFKRTDEKTA